MNKLDFIDIHQPGLFDTPVLGNIYEQAKRLKAQFQGLHRYPQTCRGMYLATLYQKGSLRTFLSFETAMRDLGGEAIDILPDRIKLGDRESVRDVAETISAYCHAFMIRTFQHETVQELARFADIPIINGLTNFSHPCQAGADLMTIEEEAGRLRGVTLAYIGDGNNVARSLAAACHYFGVTFVLCTPTKYGLTDTAAYNGYHTETDPKQAVKEADFIYTDVWCSMHHNSPEEVRERRAIFHPYQVNSALLRHAPKHAQVMHCQPMERNREITGDVADGPRSIIRRQAKNRQHFQRGLLYYLLQPKQEPRRIRRHPVDATAGVVGAAA